MIGVVAIVDGNLYHDALMAVGSSKQTGNSLAAGAVDYRS
jgi:hypothetical protein